MHTREITVGQKTLKLETGKLAKQAHGAVIVRYGDSVVLVLRSGYVGLMT
jgi:polyribonucleotide nucleotidyltransferase